MVVKGAPDINPFYGARPSAGIVLAFKSDMYTSLLWDVNSLKKDVKKAL